METKVESEVNVDSEALKINQIQSKVKNCKNNPRKSQNIVKQPVKEQIFIISSNIIT